MTAIAQLFTTEKGYETYVCFNNFRSFLMPREENTDINFDLTPNQTWTYPQSDGFGHLRQMQALMQIRINMLPVFGHAGFNNDVQIGINGFALPPMSGVLTDATNKVFILDSMSNELYEEFNAQNGAMLSYLNWTSWGMDPNSFTITHLGESFMAQFDTARDVAFRDLFRYPLLETTTTPEAIDDSITYMGYAAPRILGPRRNSPSKL